MITTAPLPHISALLRAGIATDEAATAPWCRTGDSATLLSRSSWSLALLAGELAARLGRPPRVLLPDWFCAQSLMPLRGTGATIGFVPVDEHTTLPRWSGEADMIVAVHPFGRPADLSGALALARASNAFLVEDAAHALGPAPGIGETGDAVLYSPHKTLALPAGAVLIRRNATPHLPPDRNCLPPPPPWSWLARRLAQRLMPDWLRPRLPQGGQARFDDDPTLCPPEPESGLHCLARRLMATADLAGEAAHRRANAAHLRLAAAHFTEWTPLFPDDGPAPYRLALRCSSADWASRFYTALRAARLPAESWPDLDPAIRAEPEHHAGALALRRTVILLPVHSALNGERFARLLKKISP
jgi:hypothetical protein